MCSSDLPAREAIECYCTSDDLDWSMELGFRAFKISNPVHYEEGTDGINRLEEKVAKARETVGPKADLMLNPVMSYNVEFAARVMERLKPYRLRWIEEPLVPNDMEGLSQLKRAVPTLPLATGEDHHSRHEFREMVERRCVDVLQPDLRWCGGLSEVLKIYTIGVGADELRMPGLLGFGTRVINPSADLDEATMKKIASLTGAQYFRSRSTI